MSEGAKARRLVEDFIIPKCSARTFTIKEGQILRVTAHEGKQVAELKFFNASNFKEQVLGWWSTCLNCERPPENIIGGTKNVKELYSTVPWERVLLTVIDDKVRDHSYNGSCTPKLAELSSEFIPEGGKTCFELFEECLKPHGIDIEDVDPTSTISLFMPTRYNDDDVGSIDFHSPSCEKDDYIEFQAHTDLLAAGVSCSQNNKINDLQPKGMKYEIFETN